MEHSSKSKTSSGALSKAPAELQDLIDRFNKNRSVTIDPSLADIIYVVCRIAIDTRRDPRFVGGWTALTREVRRRLFASLNMSGLMVKESEEDNLGDAPKDPKI